MSVAVGVGVMVGVSVAVAVLVAVPVAVGVAVRLGWRWPLPSRLAYLSGVPGSPWASRSAYWSGQVCRVVGGVALVGATELAGVADGVVPPGLLGVCVAVGGTTICGPAAGEPVAGGGVPRRSPSAACPRIAKDWPRSPARGLGRDVRPQHHRHLFAAHGRACDHVQVVRAGRKIARVDQQAEAAVGELGAERRGVRVTEAELGVLELDCLGRDVQPDLHAIDAAALDALRDLARVSRA